MVSQGQEEIKVTGTVANKGVPMYKEIKIRENIEQYMQEVREWLNETAYVELEEMGDLHSFYLRI